MARKKQSDLLNDGPKIGHNSNLTQEQRTKMAGFVREIEHHETQKAEIAGQIGAIYKNAKEQGFDTKAIRAVVRLRRMTREQRDAYENAVDSYKQALGMLADTPLGEAAMERDVGAAAGNGPRPVGDLASEVVSDISDPPFNVPPDEPADAKA